MPDNASDTPPPAANPLVVNAIAAFPWVTYNEPIEVGFVRILPYERGSAPGDLTHAKQSDIDVILEAYTDRRNQPVTRAALLEVEDYRTGMDGRCARLQAVPGAGADCIRGAGKAAVVPPALRLLQQSPYYVPGYRADPATNLLNLRASVRWQRYDAALFVNNALNAMPTIGRLNGTAQVTQTIIAGTFRPRTVGLSVSWRF